MLEFGLVLLGLHCFLRMAHALYCRGLCCFLHVTRISGAAGERVTVHIQKIEISKITRSSGWGPSSVSTCSSIKQVLKRSPSAECGNGVENCQ